MRRNVRFRLVFDGLALFFKKILIFKKPLYNGEAGFRVTCTYMVFFNTPSTDRLNRRLEKGP